MFCMNCGQQLPDGAKYCLQCGTPQGAVSPTGTTQAETINLDGMHTFIPALCPNCSAHMKVDSSAKVARCDSCGTECLVQDAIKALNVRGNVLVGNATINLTSKEDFEIVGGVLKKYKGALVDVVIPETVVEIGYGAFEMMRNLHSVICPSSLKIIGMNAFLGCASLASIKFTSNIKEIRANAFNQCLALTDISFPNGIEEIKENTCYCCTSLKSVLLPSSVKRIAKGAFAHCKSLTSISFPDGLELIDESAFNNCQSLTSVSIPNRTKIDVGAFANNPNLRLSLPSNTTQFDFLRILTAKNGGWIKVIDGVVNDDGCSSFIDAADTCIYSNGEATLVFYDCSVDTNQGKKIHRFTFTSYSYFKSICGNLKQNEPSRYQYLPHRFSENLDIANQRLQELFRYAGIINYKISVMKVPLIEMVASSWSYERNKTRQVGFRNFLLIQIPNNK